MNFVRNNRFLHQNKGRFNICFPVSGASVGIIASQNARVPLLLGTGGMCNMFSK